MELSTTTLALIAVISALGLVGVFVVNTIDIVQDVEAQPNFKGCIPGKIGFNSSLGRCFRGFF